MIDYDPSKAALFQPESRPPLCKPGSQWTKHGLCAELSRLAYFRFESDALIKVRLGAALACMGLRDPEFHSDDATGTQYFTAVSADGADAFLAFRGTQPDSLLDLLADANAVPVEWPGPGRVHRGFNAALPDRTWSAIMEWAGRQAPRQVWLTGHSLGAALATLCAARLPHAKLVNFGSPSVGNQAFATSFAGRGVARYVDCSDLVTRVPPALLGYRHVDGELYIDRHGALRPHADSGIVDDDRALAALEYIPLALRHANVPARELADHAPINYLRALLP